MSAKEDHARNLEINRISKNYNEVSKKNTLLEAECVKMRASMKEMAEKHSTYMKQCNEKMEEMKRHFELEKERLNEETKKESSLQRAHHFESINDIKKQLESIYNEKYNQNKMEHMNLMQQLNEERDGLKKEMEKNEINSNHSGSSYGITMRIMQYISINGYKKFKDSYIKSSKK